MVRRDDNRAVGIMHMVAVPVWKCWTVPISTYMDIEMHTVVLVVSVLVPPLVMVLPVSVMMLPLVTVLADTTIVALVMLVPVIRVAPNMGTRSRLRLGKRGNWHGGQQRRAGHNETGKYGFKHT